MAIEDILRLADKFAQQVEKSGLSLFDLFKTLPPPDLSRIPGFDGFEDTIEVWASILPGPSIKFNVQSQRLAGYKKLDPNNSEAQRMQNLVNSLVNQLNRTHAAKMIALMKKNVTPEEFATLKAQGSSGEFMLWSMSIQ